MKDDSNLPAETKLPPVNRVVHVIHSPGVSIEPPQVTHIDLIPQPIRTSLDQIWNTPKPARDIEFHSLHDVYVAGEGLVFSSNLEIFQPSITQTSEAEVVATLATLKEDLALGRIKHHPQTSLLCGKAGLNNYGHWLAEMLPRPFMSLEWVNRADGWKALIPKVYPWMAQVISDSLDLIGVPPDRRILNTGEACHVEELVFITGLSQHGQYFSPLIISAMDEVASRVPAGTHEKLWITREGEPRSLMDEPRFNELVTDHGWHVVRPLQLSFSEQVSLAKGARHMAGVNGAGLANLLFMAPGGTLTSFVPSVMPDIYYWQMCAHRGLSYREIRSELVPGIASATGWDAPLTLGPEEVLRHLHAVP